MLCSPSGLLIDSVSKYEYPSQVPNLFFTEYLLSVVYCQYAIGGGVSSAKIHFFSGTTTVLKGYTYRKLWNLSLSHLAFIGLGI